MKGLYKSLTKVLTGVLLIGAMPLIAVATPNTINYQGRLLDGDGVPVNGTVSMTFEIYMLGNPFVQLQWSNTRDVLVEDGIYQVLLGELETLDAVDFSQSLELGVTVGSDAEMIPRQPLTSVPHAQKAFDADTLDSLDSTAFIQKDDIVMELKNVVTVSASGADFTDPIAAIASITDAAADNPYLVVIGPGVYALTTTMTMKPYVSVAGSGQQVTKLMGEVSHVDSFYMSFLVVVADNTTLRDLTVVNTGDGGIATAIFTEYSSSIIQDVTALCSNGNINFGIATYDSSSNLINVTGKAFNGNNNVGVDIACSSVTMNNVYAEAYDGSTYNYGVRNHCSTLSKSASSIMINVRAKGSGVASSNVGIMNDGLSYNTPILRNCTLEGSTYGVEADGLYTQVRVMNSSINGGVRVLNGADIACLNSDNGDVRELDTNCVEILPSGA